MCFASFFSKFWGRSGSVRDSFRPISDLNFRSQKLFNFKSFRFVRPSPPRRRPHKLKIFEILIFGLKNFGPKLARTDSERIPNGPRTTRKFGKERCKTHINYWDLTLTEGFFLGHWNCMNILDAVITNKLLAALLDFQNWTPEIKQRFAWWSRNGAKHLPDCQANQADT